MYTQLILYFDFLLGLFHGTKKLVPISIQKPLDLVEFPTSPFFKETRDNSLTEKILNDKNISQYFPDGASNDTQNLKN